jgi:hypothetical protein
MNRLVIVGNGFDLAHGLPTSYRHYMDNFWESLYENHNKENIQKMVLLNDSYLGFLNFNGKQIKTYKDLEDNMSAYAGRNNGFFNKETGILFAERLKKNRIFQFKNQFFKIITIESIDNWVDIENIYYEILIGIVNKEKNKHQYNGTISDLNKEFEDVKKSLESYLNENILEQFNFKKLNESPNKLLEYFRLIVRHLSKINDHEYFNEFPPKDKQDLIDFDELLLNERNSNELYFKENFKYLPDNLFLDFNYTSSITKYVELINSQIREYGTASHIQIHGEVNSIDNNINFGFGDEMDDHYSIIEKTNDNEYLRNIKSFQYLHNSNYRKLLNWINSDKKFQVFIFGHSCGLSDRTLLNAIFENPNCRSIKIFYHKTESGDNYTELTQNISRHFNKKALMREKIVDKSLSVELPQDVRFSEKK